MTRIPRVPDGYQAVTPWVIAKGVPAFIDFLVKVFDAKEAVRMLEQEMQRRGRGSE